MKQGRKNEGVTHDSIFCMHLNLPGVLRGRVLNVSERLAPLSLPSAMSSMIRFTFGCVAFVDVQWCGKC